MIRLDVVTAGIDALRPHMSAVAVIAARLLPVTFLCPVFGGTQAPTTVKLGVALALSTFLHGAGGIGVPEQNSAMALAALVGKELVLGLTLGMVAALPFDTARMGGRFTDLFRGSSAEAALPLSGSREAATGDLLHQLLVALVAVGAAGPFVVPALARSFVVVPAGAFVQTEGVALEVARLVGGAFATGLALAAPVAGACLAADLALAFASRGAPQVQLQEFATPARVLGGAAVLWLSVGLLCQRLLQVTAETPDAFRAVLELGR